jgi:hypothetical protein
MTTGAHAIAAQHDAAGRHDEAIDALAVAAQHGDVAATVELATRLLVGDRAPLLPNEAARLLYDATVAGSAEAALRLAALTALGAYVPQSWGDALGLTVLAAERGSTAAQGQLLTLAGRSLTAVGEDWRRVAQSIDLQALLARPDGETLCAGPLVRRFAGLAPPACCEWLIGLARGRLKRALIYDPAGGGNVEDHMRTNSAASFDLATTDLVQIAVQTRMAAAVGLPVRNMEGATVLHYSPGEQITKHYDFLNVHMPNYRQEIEQRGERVISFLLYLNEGYTGGETDFPTLGIRHKGARGDGLFFVNALPSGEPDARMVHSGLPPTSGEKWLMTQFFRNRAVMHTRAENFG